jgi:putative MATE family efflux protein
MQRNAVKLGTYPVGKLLVEFSIPTMIGTVVFASTNIVNTIFVGRGVGAIALTAISLSFPVFAVFMAVGMLVGIGSGALVSLRLGEGRKDEAERIIGGALFLFLVVGICGTLTGLFFLDPILRTIGASDQSLPYARDYLRIIMAGATLNFIAMGMNNLIRAEGNPRISMYTMLIGALINVGLNYLFVFRLKIGVQGAALATIISSAVSAGWVVLHFTSARSVLSLRLRNMRFDKTLMMPALFIGLSPFLMQLSSSLVGVISNKSLEHYGGDMAVGAMAIINSVAMFIIFPIIGINQGAQPIIGFNYGAKNFDRVKKALKMAVIAASVISTAGWIGIHVAPGHIMRLFSKGDPALVKVGVPGMKIMLGMFLVVGFWAITANYFQAVGKPKVSIVLNLLRQVILFIPLVLTLPLFLGLNGVWVSAPIADTLSSFITAFALRREYRKLGRDHAAQVATTGISAA